MSSRTSVWRSRRGLPLVLLAVALPVMVAVTVTTRADQASAHGTAAYPMTRSYSCWKRWATAGASFQDPTMQQKDPMCWQAWQADPNAMWNWNGLLRDGLGEQFQQKVPDGQLCSGGAAANSGGRYTALDKPGPWAATRMPNEFNMLVADQAHHGGWYRVFVTKPGYDATRQALRWGDLDVLTTTQKFAPGAGDPNGPEGSVGVSFPVKVPTDRVGRHIVFTIWQAAHSDQSYFWCSDVIFGQGADPAPVLPAPTPTAAPAPTTAPWTPAPTSPGGSTTTPPGPAPAPPAPGDKACTATFKMVNQWPQGFQGEVRITAPGAIGAWQVRGQLPGGQTVRQVWNAVPSGSGSTLAVTNAAWNGSVSAGGSTTFGFLGDGAAAGTAPTFSCRAS
jgi:chitin-binding protein